MRPPTPAPIVILLAVLVFLFVGYMGAYYAMLKEGGQWTTHNAWSRGHRQSKPLYRVARN